MDRCGPTRTESPLQRSWRNSGPTLRTEGSCTHGAAVCDAFVSSECPGSQRERVIDDPDDDAVGRSRVPLTARAMTNDDQILIDRRFVANGPAKQPPVTFTFVPVSRTGAYSTERTTSPDTGSVTPSPSPRSSSMSRKRSRIPTMSSRAFSMFEKSSHSPMKQNC